MKRNNQKLQEIRRAFDEKISLMGKEAKANEKKAKKTLADQEKEMKKSIEDVSDRMSAKITETEKRVMEEMKNRESLTQSSIKDHIKKFYIWELIASVLIHVFMWCMIGLMG